MTDTPIANRRTVLKGLAASALAGGVFTSTSGARRLGLTAADTSAAVQSDAAAGRRIVDIVATHDHEAGLHAFDVNTTEIPAGWNTFRLNNNTEHVHFAYLTKIPQAAIDDAGNQDLFDFWFEHVSLPFQYLMDTMVPDKEADPSMLSDRYTTSDAIFPPWFSAALPSGGPGFVSGGETAITAVDLAPGSYIMECYVKDADNTFHGIDGMVELLTVTENRRPSADPGVEATLDVSLSTDGIAGVPDAVRPGQHTVRVTVQNQNVYEHFLGHDVHLLRLENGTTPEDVDGWMNWMDPNQLLSGEGVEGPSTFLGGVQTILTGGLLEGTETRTGYFTATLTPGDYLLVSELPSPRSRGFMHEFTVSDSAPAAAGLQPADHGESYNWGLGPEADDDDLSLEDAQSAMSDEMKGMFDALANYDVEDIR